MNILCGIAFSAMQYALVCFFEIIIPAQFPIVWLLQGCQY